jgi:predicted dehydrogenase
MPRAVVVGARRRRQGIGEFVASYLAAAGAEICGLVGTTEATASDAAQSLARRPALQSGRHALRPYADLSEALANERPDLVAICSPYAFHRRHLEATAAFGCHCLCEKPLWWDDRLDASALAGETAALVSAFAERGRCLGTVTQWPCTLQDFERLYPGAFGAPVERFEMLLSPVSQGPEMVLDAGPHVLSILFRLLSYGAVEDIEPRFRGAGRRELGLRFVYRHRRGDTRVQCTFRTCEQAPRPAFYAVNGKGVSRLIALPEYAMALVASDGPLLDWESARGKPSVRIADPLETLVRGFLADVERGAKPDGESLTSGMAQLQRLAAASRLAAAG